MAAFVKGDVVVVPFPFSDLSNSKRRPALVAADLNRGDLILCMITSKDSSGEYSVSLQDVDFVTGSLNQSSYVRADRIFTANERIILYKAGSLNSTKTQEVISRLVEILQR